MKSALLTSVSHDLCTLLTSIRAAVDNLLEKTSIGISVVDQGPVIPSNELSRVFEKFYRGTSRSVRRRDGTGMGLAISRGIIEAHGGKIWAESLPGNGTTFAFTLPVESKAVGRPLSPVGDEG